MEIGSHHSYLGMQITLCEGYLTVEMIHFFQKMLADVPNLKQFTTPATKEILSVTDEAMELPEHERKWFHTLVAKILFLLKRARPEISTANSFLCTRVTRAMEEDRQKL